MTAPSRLRNFGAIRDRSIYGCFGLVDITTMDEVPRAKKVQVTA